MEFRLRVPGADLWSGHKALPYEVSLMFLLLGAVYVHHLPQLLGQFGVAPSLLEKAPEHIAATVVVLLIPGMIAAATDGLMRVTAGRIIAAEQYRLVANFETHDQACAEIVFVLLVPGIVAATTDGLMRATIGSTTFPLRMHIVFNLTAFVRVIHC